MVPESFPKAEPVRLDDTAFHAIDGRFPSHEIDHKNYGPMTVYTVADDEYRRQLGGIVTRLRQAERKRERQNRRRGRQGRG